MFLWFVSGPSLRTVYSVSLVSLSTSLVSDPFLVTCLSVTFVKLLIGFNSDSGSFVSRSASGLDSLRTIYAQFGPVWR